MCLQAWMLAQIKLVYCMCSYMCVPVLKGAWKNSAKGRRREAAAGNGEVERRRVKEENQKGWKEGF